MTFAWYGHLRFGNLPIMQKWGLMGVIIISWGATHLPCARYA
ncbi:MAG: DMT family protein, partial [Bacteroidales bacterium]|nr:DMT family protein [Bacteroidales bacterium]